jgi:hypothetical protein
MCPINFVFMSCKVKKQESPEYYSVVNSKTLTSRSFTGEYTFGMDGYEIC